MLVLLLDVSKYRHFYLYLTNFFRRSMKGHTMDVMRIFTNIGQSGLGSKCCIVHCVWRCVWSLRCMEGTLTIPRDTISPLKMTSPKVTIITKTLTGRTIT